MEPTKELIDDIFRERVLRARRESPEEKLLDGPRLFDMCCRIMADGIRDEFPDAEEQRVQEILARRVALFRRFGEMLMTSEDAVLAVVDALETLHIPYMMEEPFSSNFYGIGRSTNDADFVGQLENDSLASLMNLLGPAFRINPKITFETITLTRRHILHVVGLPLKIEFFHLSDDPHDQERFQRRRRVKLLDREINLPTVEDVIITKLRWAKSKRSKDADDVQAVLAVQGTNIDWPYVLGWCDRHGTRALLDEIRGSIPPL